MWDYRKSVKEYNCFFLIFYKNYLYFYFGKNLFKIINICLLMKIKYGNNENCRNIIYEKLYEDIVIWRL